MVETLAGIVAVQQPLTTNGHIFGGSLNTGGDYNNSVMSSNRRRCIAFLHFNCSLLMLGLTFYLIQLALTEELELTLFSVHPTMMAIAVSLM